MFSFQKTSFREKLNQKKFRVQTIFGLRQFVIFDERVTSEKEDILNQGEPENELDSDRSDTEQTDELFEEIQALSNKLIDVRARLDDTIARCENARNDLTRMHEQIENDIEETRR